MKFKIIPIILLLNLQVFGQWELSTHSLNMWSTCNDMDVKDSLVVFTPNFDDFDDNERLCISTDYGRNWEIKQISNNRIFVSDITIVNKNVIFVVTANGEIFGSKDRGDTWDLKYSYSDNSLFLNYIKFFNDSLGVAMADAPSSTEPAYILRTFDGGESWENVNQNFLIGEISRDQFYVVDFPSSEVGYFYGTTNHKVYKTTDGGVNWFVMDLSFSPNSVFMIKFYDDNYGMIVESNNQGDPIHRTFDGGKTWTELDITTKTSHHDIEFLPNKPNCVWFTDYTKLYFSKNYGDTWEEVKVQDGDLHLRNIEFVDENNGFIISDYGDIYLTSNNGDMVTNIETRIIVKTEKFNLSQNYPNPFNPSTNIKYSIAENSQVVIKIYDSLGKEVDILVNDYKNIGNYEVNYDGSQLSSGIYYYSMKAGKYFQTRKFILLK